jgi:Tfp pilus assembly protein PilX
MYEKFKDRRGVALIITFLFMLTLTIIVTAFLFMGSEGTKYVAMQINDAKAFYLAEAGLDRAIWYLLNTAPDGSTDGSWRTTAYAANPGPNPTDPQQEALGDGSYTIWVEDAGANIQITSTGTVSNIQRTIRQLGTLGSGWVAVANSWDEI